MRQYLRNIKSPIIIGHRGYRAGYPENTLASFSAAVAAGADMIELDVTLSKDREVVVIHDDSLNRTTNGCGPVHQATLQELKRLDAGSWFDSRFARESLPTLEEVMVRVGRKILINVEIKSSAWESGFPDDAIERQVVDLIVRRDLLTSTLVSSFHTGFLENIAKMAVHPEIALITDRSIPPHITETCQRLGVFSWHPHFMSLKQHHIDSLHAQGILVFPYTVNAPDNILQLLNMGVDGVITDDPGMAISCISSRYRASLSVPSRN
jgi:glycerophosphoryl diester phosphodiesterase